MFKDLLRALAEAVDIEVVRAKIKRLRAKQDMADQAMKTKLKNKVQSEPKVAKIA